MIVAIVTIIAIALGFIVGILFSERQRRLKERAAESEAFAHYTRQAREEFVAKIWELHPGPNTRVVAENILIAYDQLRDRAGAYTIEEGSERNIRAQWFPLHKTEEVKNG